jgi:hypothetical protein
VLCWRVLPNCLGRAGVVVLGEAAHPLRPSGVYFGSTCMLTRAPVLCCAVSTGRRAVLAVVVLGWTVMPSCLGRGGVVVLGEAAHPLWPSGVCLHVHWHCVRLAALGASIVLCSQHWVQGRLMWGWAARSLPNCLGRGGVVVLGGGGTPTAALRCALFYFKVYA